MSRRIAVDLYKEIVQLCVPIGAAMMTKRALSRSL